MVGASPRVGSFGANTVSQLIAHFSGQVYAVNPHYKEVLSVPCFSDIASLPETPDCVVSCVGREDVESVIEACASRGVGGAVVFASGFAETGKPERKAQQDRLTQISHESGLRIAGPNCLGLQNYSARLILNFTQQAMHPCGPRSIGIASQSGAMGSAVIQAAHLGVSFSHMLTAGNCCDIDVADYVAYLAEDPACTVVACLFEGLRNPGRMLEAAKIADANDKPLLVCKIATGEKGAEAALSHTGALAGSNAAYEALFEEMGAIVVKNIEELAETASFFTKASRPAGKGAAVVAASGGFCVIAADQAEAHGVALPTQDEKVQSILAANVPEFGKAGNPCDVTAQNSADSIRACYEAFLGEQDYDTLIIPHTFAWEPGIARITNLDAVARKFNKIGCLPWTTSWIGGPGFKEAFSCENVAVFRSMESCFRTLGSWYAREGKRNFPQAAPKNPVDTAKAGEARRLIAAAPRRTLTERESKDVLSLYGIPTVREFLVQDAKAARRAADEIGYPVVLKLESPDIPHKTEANMVRLNVASGRDAEIQAQSMLDAANRMSPRPLINGILVQPMAGKGVEVMAGIRIDPLFGPLLVVGLGGILVELMNDSAVALAPVTASRAAQIVRGLRGARLLEGFRGLPPVDLDALAETLARISHFAADQADVLAECDINPLICAGSRILAVDALIVRS